MFWRRRKLPEDDEPLVPHGLISQAMEEPGSELPPDMWDNSPKDVTQAPAEPVEMRLRVAAQPQNRLQDPQTLPEQGRISPPLKWPRADEAEIARRAQGIETAVSFPYRAPVLGAAVPDADEFEPEPQTAQPAKLEIVEAPASTSVPAPEKFKKPPSRVREIRWPSLTPLRQRIGTGFSQAKRSASTSLQLASDRLKDLRSKSGDALDAAQARVLDTSNAAIAQSRSGLQHMREGIRSTGFSRVNRVWDRVRSWQITVRVPVSSKRFLSSLSAFAKTPKLQAEENLRRDSRLWTSLGMAALSALLALGLISAVRHYGPDRVEAQPTSRQTAPSGTPRATSSSQVLSTSSVGTRTADLKPSPIERAKVVKQIAVTKPSVAVAVTEKTTAPASPKKPRVRRNTDEDDYVAKDTYVFYGNAGKPHR